MSSCSKYDIQGNRNRKRHDEVKVVVPSRIALVGSSMFALIHNKMQIFHLNNLFIIFKVLFCLFAFAHSSGCMYINWHLITFMV